MTPEAERTDGSAGAAPVLPELWCARAGLVAYDEAWRLQQRLAQARRHCSVPDVLLLLEHPPVYTRGRRSTAEELPMGEDWYRANGIDVVDTDRGGRVTYHGPGQLVGYPIVSLAPYGDDVVDYIRRMERLIIDALGECGVEAGPIEGLTGVWTAERRKIASIGVHVSRGVTTHGFAINVNNDLQPFEWIVPCGIDHCEMSSLAREKGGEQDFKAFSDVVCRHFGRIYERRAVPVPADQVSARVEGLGDALARPRRSAQGREATSEPVPA